MKELLATAPIIALRTLPSWQRTMQGRAHVDASQVRKSLGFGAYREYAGPSRSLYPVPLRDSYVVHAY